jgi:hypothetical protein
VIAFDGVTRVLLGDVAPGGYQLLDHSRVDRCPVDGYLSGLWAVLEGADEKPAGGRHIPGETGTSMTWPYWSITRYRYIPLPRNLHRRLV